MSGPISSPLVLQSIVPPAAVPPRLRGAVEKVVTSWGYDWEDVSFAGTAELAPGGHGPLEAGATEVWVFAISAASLTVGDELEPGAGRGQGVGVSAFSGGVIPVTPYQALIHEFLGRRGGGGRAPERPSPPAVPTTPGTEPAAPDQRC